MMSMNSNKRKGRPASNSKLGRSSKLYNDKAMTFDGVYGNSRLMHAAASLVGCVIEVQVRDGSTYEGILRTFSHQFDLVLEQAHKVSPKVAPPSGVGPSLCNLLASFPFEEGGIRDKLIFRLQDVVTVSAVNVDADFAVKESFTDTAISKFNGQIMEKELEPWDGASSDSESTSLGVEDDTGANGWDANDMFRTNAEKYGVKSSYDTSMPEYTVVLTRKDTEEYKLNEARALRIAQEIETKTSYQSRIQLENGDEEDRYSAVVRPHDDNKYAIPQKRRGAQGGPRRQGSMLPPTAPPKAYPSVPPAKQHYQAAPHHPPQQPSSLPAKEPEISLNGGAPVEASAVEQAPSSKPYLLCHPSSQTLPPRIERRRENERKLSMQKGRNDEIEEFRKFSSNFKLTEESKETADAREEFTNAELKSDSTILANKLSEQVKIEKESETKTDISKSTLNPNAKEFVFNPNAKSFTPRSMPASSPHNNNVSRNEIQPPVQQQQQQPQRLQAQSPVIVVPQMSQGSLQMIPGLHPQPIFTAMAAPQYVMQTTPQFTPSHQPPRFRKVPLSMQPRHEISPSMHVAAATGQPILAPAAAAAMQYAANPQMHTSGPPQQAMGYPQMNFVVGPRVVSPQPVGVVPTSHSVSYCDASHLPAHLLMSANPSGHIQQSQQQHPPSAHHHHQPPQQSQPHPSPSPQPPQMYQMHHHHPPSYPPQPQVVLMQQQHAQHQLHHHHHHMVQQHGGHHHVQLPLQMIQPGQPPSATPPSFVQHPQGV